MVSKIKVSHILVEKHSKALQLIEEIKKGKSFSELAKKHSTCPSGKSGGSLGRIGRGKTVKAFERAAFNLKKGEMTDVPVKTQFGYHIIKRTG